MNIQNIQDNLSVINDFNRSLREYISTVFNVVPDSLSACAELAVNNILYPDSTRYLDNGSLVEYIDGRYAFEYLDNFIEYGPIIYSPSIVHHGLNNIKYLKPSSNFIDVDSFGLSGFTTLQKFNGNKIQTISGSRVFANCSALTSLEFPELTSLRENSLSGCSNLVSFIAPKLKVLDNRCFNGCRKLRKIDIRNVIEMNGSPFYNSAVVSLTCNPIMPLNASVFANSVVVHLHYEHVETDDIPDISNSAFLGSSRNNQSRIAVYLPKDRPAYVSEFKAKWKSVNGYIYYV